MSRQAHMELIIQNDYPAGLGETIYYVNNGKKKSSGDVQKIAKPTKKQKEELENLKEIGLKSAALRKGKPWSKNKRESHINGYIEKNLEIAKEVIKLDNQGYNKLTISKKLGISWEKVKYTLKYKNEFNSRIN